MRLLAFLSFFKFRVESLLHLRHVVFTEVPRWLHALIRRHASLGKVEWVAHCRCQHRCDCRHKQQCRCLSRAKESIAIDSALNIVIGHVACKVDGSQLAGKCLPASEEGYQTLLVQHSMIKFSDILGSFPSRVAIPVDGVHLHHDFHALEWP
jgi:hypothetical protein